MLSDLRQSFFQNKIMYVPLISPQVCVLPEFFTPESAVNTVHSAAADWISSRKLFSKNIASVLAWQEVSGSSGVVWNTLEVAKVV